MNGHVALDGRERHIDRHRGPGLAGIRTELIDARGARVSTESKVAPMERSEFPQRLIRRF
jgi:hypothetical protein